MCLNITIAVPQPYNLIGDGPEGPEVYIMTSKLKRICNGKHLTSIIALNYRYQESGKNSIPIKFLNALPLLVKNVYSKGKKTIVDFVGDWNLLISYGMSGHWRTSECKYAQLEFTFTDSNDKAMTYYWTSSRSLPTCVIQFISNATLEAELKKLGLDIITEPRRLGSSYRSLWRT